MFNAARKSLNFRPFRKSTKTAGSKPLLGSVDQLGLVLWYLKSKEIIYKLCTIFGIVPSTLSFSLAYTMEVLLKVVHNTMCADFLIVWPCVEEIQ